MRNKRQISCHNFIKVLGKKRRVNLLLQAVAQKKWRVRTAWQMAEMYITD